MAIDKNLINLILPNVDKQATSDVKNIQEFKKVLSNDDSTVADVISAAGKFGIKFIGDKTIGQVVDRAIAGTNVAKNTVTNVNKALNTTVGEVKGKPKSESAKQKEAKQKGKTTTQPQQKQKTTTTSNQAKATSASSLTDRFTGNNIRNVGTKQSTEYIKKLIVDEAKRQGVPPELALAVAQHESGFNNTAVSPKNTDGSRDHGVFQLNDRYHRLNNVYDPVENVQYGIRYLKGLLAGTNGDVAKALSNYNAGAGATGEARAKGDAYARKVMALLPQYNQNTIDTIAASNPAPEGTLDGDGNLIANDPNVTGAAAPIPQINEVMGIQTTPNQMYNDMTKYRDKAQRDAVKSLRYAQKNLMPTQAEALLNKTFGAGVQDYQDAYNTQVANLDKAYQDVQNTRATNDQELLAKFQAMRDLAAQDPRLQNQGYYLDPRNIDTYQKHQALANLASAQTGRNIQTGMADPTERARQMYEAQIANQYGVPYQEYLDSRLSNINNNMRISQGEIEYLAARAAAGDTLAQQRLQSLQAANTAYTSGLANVGKLDAENAKTAISGLLTGNTQMLHDFMTYYNNADPDTQRQIGDTLRTLISGQSGVVQSGISANSAETVAGINQQPQMLELPSQIELNKANALKARGEGQMYDVAGGLDEGQASVINFGGNYTPVNPNANRQVTPLINWGGNNGGFFNLGGNR